MIREYKLEDSVDLPRAKTARNNYPFGEMEMGQSFFMGSEYKDRARVAAAANKHKAYNPDWNYTTRKTEDGYRIWRIPVLKEDE